MKRAKYLLRNVGILTISNFASKILVFLLVPLYTAVLSTEDVGIFDLIVSTVSLLYPVLTLNIIDGVMRFSMDNTKSREDVASVGLKYTTISLAIGMLLITAASAFHLFPVIQGHEKYVAQYYVFFILYQLMLQFAKGVEAVVDMGIAGVISTLAMLTGNIVFLLVFDYGLHGFFLSNILAQLLPAVYLFFRLRFWIYLKKFSINKTTEHEMLVYSIPLIATTLGWWINSALDKYVVAFMCGVGANGLLSVAYKIPQVINTMQGIFVQAWQISAIKEYGAEKTPLFYGKSFIFINLLMCAACAWLVFLTKPLAQVLYKNDFFSAWEYVPFLVLSCTFNSASGLLGPILSAKKDSKALAKSAVFGACANMILNVVLVKLIGIQGACLATVISSLIIYVVRKKAVKEDIVISNYPIVIATWALLFIQAILEIYTHFLWAEIALMIIMIVININYIKEMGRWMKSLVKA